VLSLNLKACGISVAFGTASFFMTDNERTVRVDVCQRLLASLEEPVPSSKAQYAKRLLRYRARFAQIASAKYDEGLFASEVNVLVVRITAGDLS
jgi:lysyl-tRNA synthetase class II